MNITLDWKKYENTARLAVAEGCVLLENNGILPLSEGCRISIFGRIQNSYYKSGTGSGGKVNVAKVYGIVDGLEDCGSVKINKDLQKIYADWELSHPYDEGLGWGNERWSQDEMPLSSEIVSDAAAASDVAIVIIGRTAGEDKDNSAAPGSYLLSEGELDMLKKVRNGFAKMIVLLNTGNIIDMSFVDLFNPDAVMYVWQGGMLGGLGTADVITGKVNPSGHLTDTIAYNITDYPAYKYFGHSDINFYSEDIFCGYRYFETFAKNKVRYPFGYGLSYSEFEISAAEINNDMVNQKVLVSVNVCNKGPIDGKQVVQIYVKAPDGKLGKASRVLVDFHKTDLLHAGQNQHLNFEIPYYSFASFDDSGDAGKKIICTDDNRNMGWNIPGDRPLTDKTDKTRVCPQENSSTNNCWVLEAGKYCFYAGSDVRNAEKIFSFTLDNLLIVKKCEEALAPSLSFERMKAVPPLNDDKKIYKDRAGEECADGDRPLFFEKVPTSTINMPDRRKERLPSEIHQIDSTDYQLADVLSGKVTIEKFVSQFSDYDLSCIIRGEGMGSSLVTPGTASAFGGVSPRLREKFGIPACCCDDGPSGMRLDCGIKAFSLPNGTMLACTYNCDLITDLYSFTGMEMLSNKVENLLGPGMNIHRYPLNGRNFEYFSEDPLVTGRMGSAVLKGLHKYGVTGTIKHFAGNEQEKNRREINSVISQRALREIYLKGFEIAVKNGAADSIMTTYGLLNDLYTAGNYDLNTTILRKEWGFSGIVMTDWWASINEIGKEGCKTNFAAMIRAQNDLYMVCPDGSKNAGGDNSLEALGEGTLTRAELQRSAINICSHVMKTAAMKRLLNMEDKVEIINRPKNIDDVNLDDIEFIKVDKDEMEFDLTYQESKAKANYIFSFDVARKGTYEITLTGSSNLGDLAQLPCTLSVMGIPIASFVFNGTNGKESSISKRICCPERFLVSRLTVAENGLKLKSMKLKYLNDEIKFF